MNVDTSSTNDGETFGDDASFKLEQPIGSMSISPSGRDVVLASKEGLHIIDLDSPYSPPRYLPHRTPWEVADVQWSPFAVRDYWIVSTSNQKALVWNVGAHGWNDSIDHVLHGHSRAITDINFSAFDPDLLATCAVDSFVHGWDLRNPTRPAFSFSDWFAGATQVKFSRQNEYVVASSHDRFLHIWDRRKGAHPARTIEAHETKIYGVDWNRFEPSKIVTCSLDKTIKFWDVDKSGDVPDRIIKAPFPVWRARHTPFGWGLLAMPQRGSGDLHLYDRRPIDDTLPGGQSRTVTTFPGHKGQVKEFLWRARGNVVDGVDNRDFQLVSWGTDRELRLHGVSEDILNAVGYEKGVSHPQRLNFTRRGARYRTFRDGSQEPYSPSEAQLRTDSFPSSNQFLNARARHGTNVGMSKVSVAHFRSWVQGGRRERRTGMYGKATARPDMNPITWMKNVKITSWDTDSLAEEITQVGEKFKRVEFVSVDINHRKLAMYLQGPWGENSAIAYIRVEMRFPKSYPRDEKAIILIQKNNAISSETHKHLMTEVHTIADTYASRQRGCIEAIVRYLINEQNMEQIVSWVLGDSLLDSKTLDINVRHDDFSSESDDDNLNITVDTTNSSANIRVPLPKACGAIWANDGRLICFFPQKQKESTLVLNISGSVGADESVSGKWFEGFGRLHTSSPAHKPMNGQIMHEDAISETSDFGSDFSSQSSSSSSSSSSDSGHLVGDKFNTYQTPFPLSLRHQFKTEERSNRSTNLDGTKADIERRLNIVSLHSDVRALLPAQKGLAERYKIFGSAKEVCEHNANIANAAGLSDIAAVWNLVGMLLEHTVPLEFVRANDRYAKDMLLVAQKAFTSLQKGDTAINSSLNRKSPLNGQLYWGGSPLASSYLIPALFSHFEHMADIQMLAMLSCILMHNDTSKRSQTQRSPLLPQQDMSSNQSTYFSTAEVALSQLHPPRLISRTSANRKSARDEVQWQLSAIPSISPRAQRASTSQVEMAYNPDSSMSHNASREARLAPDSSAGSASNMLMKMVSELSPSDDQRSSRRSTSGSTFAASRASLNALAQTFSNSPPNHHGITSNSKRLSPSASLTSGTWSNTLFNRDTSGRSSRQVVQHDNHDNHDPNVRSSASSIHLWDTRRDSRGKPGIKTGVSTPTITGDNSTSSVLKKSRKRGAKVRLHNQNHFDLDGHVNKPLLEPRSRDRYMSYRACYADLLEMWDLPIKRAEMLFEAEPASQSILAKRDFSKSAHALIASRLDVTQCCHDCACPLIPVWKNGIVISWHCGSISYLSYPNKISKAQTCSICQKVVHGLTVPCMQCGHMTCYNCAQEWFVGHQQSLQTADTQSKSTPIGQISDNESEDDIDNEDTSLPTCPTGCGCPCSTLTTITITQPSEPTSPTISKRRLTSSTTFASSFHDPISGPSRSPSIPSIHSVRYNPEGVHETALGAMLALSSRQKASTSAAATLTGTRTRGGSTATTTTTNTTTSTIKANKPANNMTTDDTSDDRYNHTREPDSDAVIVDELVPWATMDNGDSRGSSGGAGFSRFTSLGRGIGGGLSRGLSNRSSDATIRKI